MCSALLSDKQSWWVSHLLCPCLRLSSDLSNNPFECHCKLSRLVRWLREKGVQVRRPEAMLCDQPAELRHQPLLNVSLLTCGTTEASFGPFCSACLYREGTILIRPVREF